MLPIRVSVSGPLPVFQPPDDSEPECLVPADAKCKYGANYVAINQINKKRYEGESVNFHNRHDSHKTDPFNPNCRQYNSHFYNSIRKYGWKNFKWYFRQTFEFVGLEQLNKEEREAFFKAFKASYLHPCETYWIRRLGLLNPDKGYNKQESGKGGAGHAHTAEAKAKLSKPVTSCKILDEYANGDQLVEFVLYASAADAEKKTNVSQGHISACCNKKRKSAGERYWHFTKKNDEVGTIRVSRIGDKPMPGNEQRKRKVISVSPSGEKQLHEGSCATGRTLSDFTGKKFSQGIISLCCNGKRKTHQGYTFYFASDEMIAEFEKQNTKKRKRKRT